jgi:hypothetical protein
MDKKVYSLSPASGLGSRFSILMSLPYHFGNQKEKTKKSGVQMPPYTELTA